MAIVLSNVAKTGAATYCCFNVAPAMDFASFASKRIAKMRACRGDVDNGDWHYFMASSLIDGTRCRLISHEMSRAFINVLMPHCARPTRAPEVSPGRSRRRSMADLIIGFENMLRVEACSPSNHLALRNRIFNKISPPIGGPDHHRSKR